MTKTRGLPLLCALERAERAARRGKRARPEVARFELMRERHLGVLRDELAAGSYRPAPYQVFTIQIPKTRTIAALPFRDRIVQHLLMAELAPRIERALVPQTYACLPRRGSHAALARAVTLARTHRHLLQLDIRKFFPSVSHAILRAAIGRLLRANEDGLSWLTDLFLNHDGPFERARFYFPNDDLFATLRPVGLPIGNLTSQWWANLYLSPLDHVLANTLGIRAFCRYMDDIVVFDDDADRLSRVLETCAKTCERLRLKLHERKTQMTQTRHGFRFLGFHIQRIEDAVRVRITSESVTRMRRRLARLAALYEVGAVSTAEVRSTVFAWIGHARHGHTRALCGELLRDFSLTH